MFIGWLPEWTILRVSHCHVHCCSPVHWPASLSGPSINEFPFFIFDVSNFYRVPHWTVSPWGPLVGVSSLCFLNGWFPVVGHTPRGSRCGPLDVGVDYRILDVGVPVPIHLSASRPPPLPAPPVLAPPHAFSPFDDLRSLDWGPPTVVFSLRLQSTVLSSSTYSALLRPARGPPLALSVVCLRGWPF